MTAQIGFLEVSAYGTERVVESGRASSRPLTTRGKVGADEASERMPAFVLEQLGDALQSFNREGVTFTFEQVRLQAEASEAVKSWLAVATRQNVLGGWTRSRIKLFNLQRAGDTEALRDARRGARSTLWRFPTP